MDEDTRGWIIKELAKARPHDQVIMELCKRLRIGWGDAESLVAEVQQMHGDKVVLRQAPALIILAVVAVLGGALLLINGISLLMAYPGMTASTDQVEVAMVTYSFGRALLRGGGMILTGVAMIAGSLLGLRGVWHAFIVWVEGLIWPEE